MRDKGFPRAGTAVQRWSNSGMRLGVKRAPITAFEAYSIDDPTTSVSRTPVPARNSLSNHIDEIAWSKSIGRRDDVGLAPANELLAEVQRHWAVGHRRGQATNRQCRAQSPAISEIQAPGRFDMTVRVDPRVNRHSELEPRGRQDEDFSRASRSTTMFRDRSGVLRERMFRAPRRIPALSQGLRRAV